MSLRAGEWLRVGLLAGLVAAAVATLFDLVIAERVLDRAVRLETHLSHPALAVPEPFSRSGRRGGLVVGELILGAGTAFLLAGAATLLGPRARSATRLWILMTTAGIWGVVVLPGIVYPPLPPGVPSTVAIGERQALYLAVVAVGVGGFAVAVRALSAPVRFPRSLAIATALAPAALALAWFPDTGADTTRLPAGFLTDFRIVSIVSQSLFWTALALAGAVLLQRSTRPSA